MNTSEKPGPGLKWPITVDTPEGQIPVYWIHRVFVSKVEVDFRLVSSRETFVLRCPMAGSVRNIKGDHVKYVEETTPELNPPIAINTQRLQDSSVRVDASAYFAGVIHRRVINRNKDARSSEIQEGKILLEGGLLVPCFGYYHDGRTFEEAGFAIERMEGDGKTHPTDKEHGDEEKPHSLEEHLLLKIALGCPGLDSKTRRRPSHWEVFLAAWKDGMSAYEMTRRHGWNRRTADGRLSNVQRSFLHGAKISQFQFSPAILRNVEAEISAAHEHNAERIDPRAFLDNTTAAGEDED